MITDNFLLPDIGQYPAAIELSRTREDALSREYDEKFAGKDILLILHCEDYRELNQKLRAERNHQERLLSEFELLKKGTP